MKKLLALLLALVMIMSFAACSNNSDEEDDEKETTTNTEPSEDPTEEPTEKEEDEVPTVTVMTYAEFMAAETDAKVCIESYIQANQAWWFDSDAGHGKITLYLQDEEGAYFAYEVNCSEEDSALLTQGTKVRITGEKAEWAGEIEIMNGTIEVLDGDMFIAAPQDVTELMGTDALEAEMNKLVTVNGMTVKSVAYKDDKQGNDIYVTLTLNGADYEFCVESYLTDAETDLYKAVEALKEGDVVNVTGFLYWYEGPNTHITEIEAA